MSHAQSAEVIFLHLQRESSGTAAAEQLVAEEAHEAAKAAAKKAKKQKAKARKQQARSDATPASEPVVSEPPASCISTSEPSASDISPSEQSAGASLQTQQNVDPIPRLHQLSLSDNRDDGLSPDQFGDDLQPELDMAVHAVASSTSLASAAPDEQVSTSAAAAEGLPVHREQMQTSLISFFAALSLRFTLPLCPPPPPLPPSSATPIPSPNLQQYLTKFWQTTSGYFPVCKYLYR